MELIATIIFGILGLVVGWFQIDHRFKRKKNLNTSNETNVLNEVLLRKTLKVGWFNYPPFISKDKSNSKSPVGLYPEIIKKVSDKFNLEVQWIQLNLSDAVEMVKTKKVDIIVSVFQTPNRARLVDFTAFLHSVIVGGVTKNEISDIHSQSDLLRSNYSITVAKNEIGHELVDAIKIPHSRVTIIDTGDISKIISFVKTGDTDIVLLDSLSIQNYFAATPKHERKNIKQIFVRRPLAVCQHGTMILQNQIEFANWLDTEFRIARDSPDILEYEAKCLENFQDIVSKS